MPKLVWILWVCCLGSIVARAETTLEERTRINQAAMAVYRIHATYSESKVGTGSAIHLGGGRYATSCHLTRDAKGVRVSRAGKFWQAYWQHKNVERDLCIIMTHEVPPHAAQLAPADSLRVGQRVFAAGYPASLTGLNIQYGTIRALYEFDGGKIIRATAFFARGESGGALFDDQGRVVGVLTFKSGVGADQNFSVPMTWIDEVEPRAQAHPSPVDAFAFWEGAFEPKPMFLGAAALEAEENWASLLDMAQAWSRVAASDPEPLLAISKALFHTQHERDAIVPARAALALNPDHAESWVQLVQIYRKLNDNAELEKALARVAKLSPDRAEDFELAQPSLKPDCQNAVAGC